MSAEATLRSFIKERFLPNYDRELDTDEALFTSGIIDSFGIIEVGVYLEETFNIKIDDSELRVENMDSIAKMLSLIDSKKSN